MSQTIYHRGFDQYYRLNTAFSVTKELQGVKSSAFELTRIEDFVWMTIYLIIFIIFMFIYKNRKLKPNPKLFIIRILSIVLLIILSISGFIFVEAKINSTLKDVFLTYKSDCYLYDKVYNTNKFVDTFGLNTLFFKDIKGFLNKIQVLILLKRLTLI